MISPIKSIAALLLHPAVYEYVADPHSAVLHLLTTIETGFGPCLEPTAISNS